VRLWREQTRMVGSREGSKPYPRSSTPPLRSVPVVRPAVLLSVSFSSPTVSACGFGLSWMYPFYAPLTVPAPPFMSPVSRFPFCVCLFVTLAVRPCVRVASNKCIPKKKKRSDHVSVSALRLIADLIVTLLQASTCSTPNLSL
jgi:hypothetical protein